MIDRMVSQIIEQLQQNALSAEHALAALQVLAGVLFALGTTLIAIGSGFAIAMTDSTDSQFVHNMRMSSAYYIGGFILLVLGARLFGKAFFKPRKKDKSSIQTPKLKILVDEMLDGTDEKLRNAGYDASSVKRLIEQGEIMHSDFSVLKHVEKHDMVLITEDEQHIRGCEENGMIAVRYGQNETFENLVMKLGKLKNSDNN